MHFFSARRITGWKKLYLREPHAVRVVELVECQGLSDGVESFIDEVSSNDRRILLFDDAVILLVIGPAAGKLSARKERFPEADWSSPEKVESQ